MSRVVKRSAREAIKTSRRARQIASPLPRWIPPQLCEPVETAPSGPQWLHEIKLDGFRMSARIEHGRVQLLTRTGLDWSDKYPSIVAVLANVRAKNAYVDGELCGVGDDGLPSFSQTQAASHGERGVRLAYYAFDLLHLDGRDTASLPLIERKALLQPLIADIPGLQFNGHETATASLFASTPASSGSKASFPRRSTRPMRRETGAYGAKPNASIARSSSLSAGRTLRDRGLIWARFCSATMPTMASSSMPAALEPGCRTRCSPICGAALTPWRAGVRRSTRRRRERHASDHRSFFPACIGLSRS
jgi:hypothetical protein